MLSRRARQPLIAQCIMMSSALYPEILLARLGRGDPPLLTAIGPVDLLDHRKTVLFCSARTPGDAILRAHDTARRMRDEGALVISVFHSPIEKGCLKILLRGKQPIIICPARAIDSMRIPADCRASFETGRILFLSPFDQQPRRTTRDSALRRNEVIAALADEACVAHRDTGGKTDQIVRMLSGWQVPVL